MNQVDQSEREPDLLILLSYIRSLVSTILCFVWTALYGCLAVFSLSIFSRQDLRNFFYRSWGKVCMTLFGIQVEVRGKENAASNISGGAGVIYLFNHTSNFDIPVINSVFNESVRWGAKIELFKIPLFGRILKSMGVLPIARTHREEVFKVYSESIPRIKKGECFLLAPEGTRKDGSRIYPFKSGPFLFGIEAQCPIIPVLIYGAWKIQPKEKILPAWGKWRNKVIVQILPPLFTNGMNREHRQTLQEQAYHLMSQGFEQLKREFN